MKSISLGLLLSIGLISVVTYSPLPIPPHLDFLSIYHADLGLLRGIPLYDYPGQIQMVAKLAHVGTEQVTLLPFVYPPWYALLTLAIALLPIEAAARFWFALNLLLMFRFVSFMTDGWTMNRRWLAFLFSVLFLPVLGALFVGQLVFPILLATGILVYALPRERPWLTAIALFLLTFKPHIGGFVFLLVIVYLFLKRSPFGRKALWRTVTILAFFFAASFLVDHAWPVHYLETLFGFGEKSPCELACVSVPMTILSFSGPDFTGAVGVAVILLFGWTGLFVWKRPGVWKDAKWLTAVGFCITLLSSPYQYNYDFVVLLLPFFLLASTVRSKWDWILLAIAYSLPWMGLMFGRQGNQLLLISLFGLSYLIWLKTRPGEPILDVYPQPMYNHPHELREE